jgi:hypothetical protein
LVPEQWRYFLLVALLAKEARERLPLSMPRLPAPIRPRKYYAQVDTPRPWWNESSCSPAGVFCSLNSMAKYGGYSAGSLGSWSTELVDFHLRKL